MTKSKKVLSLVLAIVMVCSLFAVNTFAAESDNTADFKVVASTETLTAGATVTFTVSVTTNYNVGPISVPISYDSNAFEFVANSATATNIYGETATDVEVNSATAGSLVVVFMPVSGAGATTGNLSDTDALFTFDLKVKEGVTSGNYTVGITADTQKSATNLSGTWYCGSCASTDPAASSVVTMGQTFTQADAAVGFANATPELQLSATGTTRGIIVDTHRCVSATNGGYAGSIYGFAANKTVANTVAYFTATNGGSVSITTYSGTRVGTGSTLVLKNSGGETVATYVLILFGDLNGDGRVNTSDASLSEANISAGTVGTGYNCFNIAHNANGDRRVNTADATALASYVSGGTDFQVTTGTALSALTTATSGYTA